MRVGWLRCTRGKPSGISSVKLNGDQEGEKILSGIGKHT